MRNDWLFDRYLAFNGKYNMHIQIDQMEMGNI